jgi:hypothetical protein
MTKNVVSGFFIGVGILVISVAASAQGNNVGMIKLNGGRSAILATAPAEPLTPAQLPP